MAVESAPEAAAGTMSTPPSGSESSDRADELKNQGNKKFGEGHFPEAIDLYTQAIEADPLKALIYCNRSLCHIKMETYGLAIADATTALEIDPKCVKAYYRRGSAYMGLGKYKDARTNYKKACQLKPNDRDAALRLKECEKEVKREQFEKAIASEHANDPPLAQSVHIDDIVVEDSYTGPRLSWPITAEFVKALTEHFKDQKSLHKRYVFELLKKAEEIFKELPTVFDVPVPEGTSISVCGDTHGQYYDLLNIFAVNGWPTEDNPYLFNGDFVDRGSFSFEVVLTLIAFKCLLPRHFHMTRGNHESKTMNKMYGFEGEVKHKYSDQMFHFFSEVFNWLPLGAVIGNKVFVVHGGLFSRDDVTLAELRKVDRNREPPEEGLMSEMLWSDPQPSNGRAPSKRGVGLSFGPDVTKAFLERNNLELVVRSHEVKDAGYEVEADGKLITVFSAPNYCDQMGNKGALLRFDSDMRWKAVQFEAVPHPPIRPMQYASMGALSASELAELSACGGARRTLTRDAHVPSSAGGLLVVGWRAGRGVHESSCAYARRNQGARKTPHSSTRALGAPRQSARARVACRMCRQLMTWSRWLSRRNRSSHGAPAAADLQEDKERALSASTRNTQSSSSVRVDRRGRQHSASSTDNSAAHVHLVARARAAGRHNA
eukprot:CAMPEP_0119407366 /NCGR_PEP_ID=MMETSP1335-20130426/1281_1 /TAXON_ID=259385 /ORGANISM="Chrysoculter rhomboideus, Strain RCC1486" /LENGTH=658 /DNA_ID=CAMNT_0007431465 /DNA_START=1 /DNA_END=1979 /DNA_ORIENTATION=-